MDVKCFIEIFLNYFSILFIEIFLNYFSILSLPEKKYKILGHYFSEYTVVTFFKSLIIKP